MWTSYLDQPESVLRGPADRSANCLESNLSKHFRRRGSTPYSPATDFVVLLAFDEARVLLQHQNDAGETVQLQMVRGLFEHDFVLD